MAWDWRECPHVLCVRLDNMGDVLIDEAFRNMIEIIPVSDISEVFEYAMGSQRNRLIEKLKRFASEKKIAISLPETIPAPSRSI